MGAVIERVAGSRAGGRPAASLVAAGYTVLLVACTVLSLVWLAIGGIVGVAAHAPGVAARLAADAAAGDRWAQGVIDAVPSSEPAVQAALDYAFSVFAIVLAFALVGQARGWSVRLLVLALIGSAGAFNLQAHAAAIAVESAVGLAIGGLHQVLLHGVACAAYIVALMVFPPGRDLRPAGAGRTALVVAGVGTLLLVGFGTALLPHTTSCILFFGFLVPLVGVVVLPHQVRSGSTAAARTQARLLLSVLAVAVAVAVVLAGITLLLWSIGWAGVMLADPTAHGGPGDEAPTALLFWFSRLACIGIAGAVLVATRRDGLWTAERLFSRGLAAGLTAALVGGGYCVLRTTAGFLLDDSRPDRAFAAAALATAVTALALLPVYVRAERLADRLLYGTRPTPYSVLAGVAALSRVTSTDAPDLGRVAEAVGRGLGATTCRLTVARPGLGDRSYTWVDASEDVSGELVEVPVRHGAEPVGSIAVDRTAVAGLQQQRQHLLDDVADSLGVVLQASRFGIELERQLRAALAHANEIAVSRRAVVAEMDGERRRIERNLHDGAQHHLVSLRLTLGLVEHQVSTGQFEPARSRLDQVAGQIDLAESILAETSTGVSSPLLAEAGLVRALTRELAAGQPPVGVDTGDLSADVRFPPDVEAAVYYCCLEAVNNVRKHAQGASAVVRLGTEDGRLHFSVRDDGPGWDQSAGASPGRGLRNVAARIGAVGGRVEIRSARGAGTTVEGSVPVPHPADPLADDVPAERVPTPPLPALPAASAAAVPLLDEVRDAVRAARELYHGTTWAEPLRGLAERLDEPLQIVVAGAEHSGAEEVVAALDAPVPAGRPRLPASVGAIPRAGSDGPRGTEGEAFVLLIRHDAPDDAPDDAGLPPHLLGDAVRCHPAHAIGALVLDEPVEEAERAAARCATRPEVRRLCHVVVPVVPSLVAVALGVGDAEYGTLRTWAERLDGSATRDREEPLDVRAAPAPNPTAAVAVTAPSSRAAQRAPSTADPSAANAAERELLDRFGPVGVRHAVATIRSGQAPTSADLAAALLRCSGLARLRELVDAQLASRGEILTARSVLLALEGLVRTDPPPGDGDLLRYRLDRIRSGAHELTESDVVDALRGGELDLPDEERREAEQLLGAAGRDARTRLALAPDAGRQEVVAAASEQLGRWQRRAAHPMVGNDARTVAGVLVQTCERLLAEL